jgi:branched-chain amino acid transport system ATP-binding protein
VSGFIGMDNARVSEGAVVYNGRPIHNMPPHRITEMGIALVPERDKIFETLSVAENLDVTVSRDRSAQQRDHIRDMVYAQFPHLADLRDRQAGYLSGGERQMLTIGAALMCAPELLLIDELSLGLAPLIVEDLMRRLRTLRDEFDITILLVDQNAQAALDISDHGYVMENGRIVLEGQPQHLLGHQDIQEFYLGQSEREDRRSYRKVKQYRRSRRWYG